MNKTSKRYLLIAQKFFEYIDKDTAASLIFSGRSGELRTIMEKKLGTNAFIMFNRNNPAVFFDELETLFSVSAAVSKKRPLVSLSPSYAPLKVQYGEFAIGFARNPYRATLSLVDGLYPYLNEELRSILATDILYLAHVDRIFSPQAAIIIANSYAHDFNEFPSISSIYSGIPMKESDEVIRYYANYLILQNISNNRSLFTSIETPKKLAESFEIFKKMHANIKREDGREPLYYEIFVRRAELSDVSSHEHHYEKNSTLLSDPVLAEKIGAYVSKIDYDINSDICSRQYSAPEVKERFSSFLLQMMSNYVLGLSYLEKAQPHYGRKNHSLVGRIPHFEQFAGISIPCPDQKLEKTLDAKDSKSREYLNSYNQAIISSVLYAIKNKPFKRDDVILDTSWYHDSLTETWIRNVKSDSSALHAFFDIANLGIECCASRFFSFHRS